MYDIKHTPALPCPECRDQGHGGMARIGNRRRNCSTCNLFAQKRYQRALLALRDRYPDEYQRVLLEVEFDLYKELVEQMTKETNDG